MPDKMRGPTIAVMAVYIVAVLSPTPVDAGGAVTTSTFLPLSGSVINAGGGSCNELVNLSGMVHVVSIIMPNPPPISQNPQPPPIKVHFNMAGVLGTGSFSNATYVATGAQDFRMPAPPPITPQGFALAPTPPPIFQLEGTDSCAEQVQLPVNFNLIFDSTGHLLPSSTASLVCQVTDLNNCQ
jgi:hypothetical protein